MNFKNIEIISDKIKRLSNLIGKEYTGKILNILFQNPYKSASEVAKILNIHIATAQSYLEELEKFNIISFRTHKVGTRPYKEYFPIKSQIKIEIDLNKASEINIKNRQYFEKRLIREKKDLNVLYDIKQNESKIIKVYIHDDSERKRIKYSLDLNDIEGKFMWFIPFPSENPCSILDICKKAEINEYNLKHIKDFVEKLYDHNLIDIVIKK